MRKRARLFQRSQKLAGRLPGWAKAAHSFLWLHALDVEDLSALTLDSYASGRAEPFAGEDHNFEGLWDWEKAAVEQWFAGCRSILVAGAGGGREVIALARLGYEVAGFDASEDMVDAGRGNLRKADVDATILHAGAGDVPHFGKAFDALMIGRGVYHHIPRRAQRIGFLRSCARELATGAPVLIGDFLARPAAGHRLSRLALSRRVERGDLLSSSFYHFFTRDEIASELAGAGMQLIEYRSTQFPGGDGLMAHAFARASF